MHQGFRRIRNRNRIASVAKEEMREKTGERMSESKRSAAAAEVADVESEERAKTMRQTSLAKCPILKIKADNSVSKIFKPPDRG